MGYYITLIDADFRIPKESLDPAFEALTELNKRDDLKTGGGGGRVWFAWVGEDYPARALKAVEEGCFQHPTEAVFQDLGFGTEYDEDGSLRLLYYDNKRGDEEHFLRAVAPFVVAGSYLAWRGEEGEMWRIDFDGDGGIKEKVGRVVFGEAS